MKRKYCEFDDYVIVEVNGKYGIEDKGGHLLLPLEYESIVAANRIYDSAGFILIKEGKFGYVEFGRRERLFEDKHGVILGNPSGCALAFLPCMYDLIETKRNGLAIRLESETDVKDLWYDYKSRTLYRQVRYVKNLGGFDVLVDFSQKNYSCIPEIKRAGADEWVRFGKDVALEIIEMVHTDIYGVTVVLCTQRISETAEKTQEFFKTPDEEAIFEALEYEEIENEYNEYSFLLLYKEGWTVTSAKRTIAELYAEVPAMTKGHIRRGGEEFGSDKKTYRILCKYKKKNEGRD